MGNYSHILEQRVRLQVIHMYASGTEVLEAFLAIETALFGLWLVSPFWDTFAAIPNFQLLSEFASRFTWGGVLLVLGVFRLVSVLIRWRAGRYTSAFSCCMIWCFLATLLARNDYRATGVPIYYTFALASILILFRLSSERLEGNG